MIENFLAITSLVLAVLTFLWVALLIKTVSKYKNFDVQDNAIAYAHKRDKLYYLSYINVGLITIAATILCAGLYLFFKDASPVWSFVAVIFVPVYCILNLFSYLSQIAILPRLLKTRKPDGSTDPLIAQMIQMYPGSIVSILNILAYAVLGIPSIIFGVLMLGEGTVMAIAGVLLLLNGVACIIGFAGQNSRVAVGALIGGALFAFSLIQMTIAFFQL